MAKAKASAKPKAVAPRWRSVRVGNTVRLRRVDAPVAAVAEPEAIVQPEDVVAAEPVAELAATPAVKVTPKKASAKKASK